MNLLLRKMIAWGQWEINMVKLLLKDFNLDGDYKNKIVVKY